MGDTKVLDAELQQRGDGHLSCLQQPTGDEMRATQDGSTSPLKTHSDSARAHRDRRTDRLGIKGHNNICPARVCVCVLFHYSSVSMFQQLR